MKKTILFLSIFLISVLSFCQPSQRNFKYNFGFENKNSRETLPTGWTQWGMDYTLRYDTLTKNSGRASMMIEPYGEKKTNTFGCVALKIPVMYEAKEIEVKAYMKLNAVTDGTIGLMIRIDGPSGVVGFENMMGKNIQGTMDWTPFSVKIPYPEDGEVIYIGAILSGKGQLWVDDFEVLLDGIDHHEAKLRKLKEYKADADKEFDGGSKISTITLDKRRTEDLVVLGQTWGFLKYHHPAIATGDYNWDYELFRVLPKIMEAQNQTERNTILNSWIAGLGKFETEDKQIEIKGEIKIAPDLVWINPTTLGTDLASSLNEVKRAKRSSGSYYIGNASGIGNPQFKNEQPYNTMNYPDVGFRLLSLYRYWNMIHYYFPYKNLIKEDWNKVLEEFIPKFINARNDLEYKLSTLSLIARIHDSHANIWGMDEALNNYKGQKYAPLEVKFVENKAVVTGYFDKTLGEKTGLKVGDVIEVIESKSVDEIVKEKLPFTPASNYATQLRDIARDLLRTNKSTLSVEYRSGTKKYTAEIGAYNTNEINIYLPYQKSDTCFKVIDSEIAYLYPGSVKAEYLSTIMAEVKKTKGLIIDFRCYPSAFLVFTLSEYLLPEPKSFAKFSNGSVATPGLFTMQPDKIVGKSNPDYYKGKVVIIVNEMTQSSAEYHTMAFRTAPKATVIGSTTAGADGDISRIFLPGVSTMISGIGVYYPDGTETQRVGIVPDMEVKPTIKGIREGRDELLEKAIRIINN